MPEIQAVLRNLTQTEIKLIVRADACGPTNIWTDAFSAFSPEWKSKIGPLWTWPETFFNGTYARAQAAPGIDGIIVLTQVTPYALGFVGYWAAHGKVEWGYLMNKRGFKSTPLDIDYLENTVEHAQFDQ